MSDESEDTRKMSKRNAFLYYLNFLKMVTQKNAPGVTEIPEFLKLTLKEIIELGEESSNIIDAQHRQIEMLREALDASQQRVDYLANDLTQKLHDLNSYRGSSPIKT